MSELPPDNWPSDHRQRDIESIFTDSMPLSIPGVTHTQRFIDLTVIQSNSPFELHDAVVGNKSKELKTGLKEAIAGWFSRYVVASQAIDMDARSEIKRSLRRIRHIKSIGLKSFGNEVSVNSERSDALSNTETGVVEEPKRTDFENGTYIKRPYVGGNWWEKLTRGFKRQDQVIDKNDKTARIKDTVRWLTVRRRTASVAIAAMAGGLGMPAAVSWLAWESANSPPHSSANFKIIENPHPNGPTDRLTIIPIKYGPPDEAKRHISWQSEAVQDEDVLLISLIGGALAGAILRRAWQGNQNSNTNYRYAHKLAVRDLGT